MAANPDRHKAELIDIAVAAVALGVKPATIRSWVQRGYLTQRGTDSRRRTLYDYTELLKVQRDRFHGRRPHRDAPPLAKGGRPRKSAPPT